MGTSCDGTLIETHGIGFNTRRLPKTSFGVAKGYLGSEFRNEKPAAHPCSTFLFETPSGLLRAPWAPNSETKNLLHIRAALFFFGALISELWMVPKRKPAAFAAGFSSLSDPVRIQT